MRLGTGTPSDFRLGTAAVQRLFLGATQVWARPAGGFTPASLFALGEQGGWWDPSDLSTLWQDTAATIPVTADGQAVARVNDKSGRGNHFTQSTVARRPAYRTGGGLHWLQFDGVDDGMVCATGAMNFGTITAMMAASELAPGSASPVGSYWGFPHPAGANPFWRLNLAKFSSQWVSRVNGGVANFGAHATGVAVSTMQTDLGTFRVNGTQRGTFTAQTITYPEPVGLVLAFNPSLTQVSPYNFFGFVVRQGAITTQARGDLEAWMAAKAGVTL